MSARYLKNDFAQTDAFQALASRDFAPCTLPELATPMPTAAAGFWSCATSSLSASRL
jgi:hypothetical protein